MKNETKQTAVDSFAEKTFNLIELMKREWVNQEEFLDGMLKARNEAKEMEKEQIEEAYKRGWDSGDFGSDCWEEIYYNETYGGNK